MRLILILLLAALTALAADGVLTDAEKAKALEAMIKVSVAQTEIARAESRYTAEQVQRQEQLRVAGEAFEKVLEELRTKHGKAGDCNLDTSAQWQCPETNDEIPITPDSSGGG